MAKQALNPETLFNSEQYGFSQIVVTQGSRTIYLSGSVQLFDGTIRSAEIHWYEAHGIGQHRLKIKRFLG